jgi:hypothetical protein
VKESASPTDVVVLALTLAAAVFGLATAAVQFLASHTTPTDEDGLRPAARILRLTTSPLQPALHQSWIQRLARRRPSVVLVFGLLCLGGLFLFERTRPDHPDLPQAVSHVLGSSELVVAIVLSIWIYSEIRGVQADEPIRSRFAMARLEGDFSALADRCQGAAQGVGGFAAAGADVVRSPERFLSQAWIPGWFAYRLTIELARDGDESSLRIESANFWPFLFHERSNADNVRKALDAIVRDSEPPGPPIETAG